MYDSNNDMNLSLIHISTMVFHVLFIAFTFFSGWHTGGKSIFQADTITDSAEFMVAPLIGNILVMINKRCV